MEAVEDLMVGEEAGLGLVVDEALMDRRGYRSEADVVAPVLENRAEAVGLVRGVGEDQYAVSLAEEVGERVGDQVEVLVV